NSLPVNFYTRSKVCGEGVDAGIGGLLAGLYKTNSIICEVCNCFRNKIWRQDSISITNCKEFVSIRDYLKCVIQVTCLITFMILPTNNSYCPWKPCGEFIHVQLIL